MTQKFGARGPVAVLTELYLALMFSVFLLFPGFGGYRTITEDKFFLLCILSGGYIGLSLLLTLELWLVGGKKTASLPALVQKSGWLPRLMLAYLLWAGIATACSVSPLQSLWGGSRREGLVSLFLYVGAFFLVCLNTRASKRHLWLFGCGISLCCVVALIQLAGYNPFGLYPEGMTYYDGNILYSGEFLGTVGNAGLLTAVLCIAVPVFWTALVRTKGRDRLLLLIPLTLSLVVLFGSRVEAGIVGVIGGALLTVPVIAPQKTLRNKLALLSIAVILMGLAAVYFLGEHLPGFLYEANRLLHGQAEDTFGSGRIYIWRSVIPLIGERPLFGGGPETLGLRGNIVFERFHEELGILLRSQVDTAHNEYLNVAVELGLPALVFYLGGLLFGAVCWIRTAPYSDAAAICGAGVMGYCVQSFFGISSVVSAPFFWITLGLLAAEFLPKETPSSSHKQRRKQK